MDPSEDLSALRPYRRTLQGLTETNGKFPTIDIQDAPNGGRYAIFSESSGGEDGSFIERSGLEVLKGGPLSRGAQERRDGILKSVRRAPARERTPLAADVKEQIDENPEDTFEVNIRLKRVGPGLTARLERAIARGATSTVAHYRAKRAELMTVKLREVSDAVAAFERKIQNAKGEVFDRGTARPAVLIAMTGRALRQVSKLPEIARISFPGEEGNLMPEGVDTQDFLNAHQVRQFKEETYDGEGAPGQGTSNDLHVVNLEGLEDDHPVFRESAHDSLSSSQRRISGRGVCDMYDCQKVNNFVGNEETEHGTNMAALILGDLYDDQDEDWTSTSNQEKRSGLAGEARLYAFHLNGGAGSPSQKITEAIQTLMNQNGFQAFASPHVMNMATFAPSDDPDCEGSSDMNSIVNDLFLDGVLTMKAAGNRGTAGGPGECTITSPGSAASVFTVGASEGLDGDWGDCDSPLEVRASLLAKRYSSIGGPSLSDWAEGRRRTIVDGIVYGCAERLPTDGPGSHAYDENQVHGTSISVASASGMALSFIDYYKQERNDDIDDPGYLFVNLLLMGDRLSQNGSYLTSGYDNWTGSGRLKFRMWNNRGMDSRWKFKDSYFCLDDGESRIVRVTSDSPNNTDMIKAVSFIFDPDHEYYGHFDHDLQPKVELKLYADGDLIEKDTAGSDNKRRVYADLTANKYNGAKIDLKWEGVNVPTDRESGGSNSIRVYYAYYYEDTARNDSNGPTLAEIAVG